MKNNFSISLISDFKFTGGEVTFLFTDIEGSTKLSQDYPETLQQALDRHNEIMNDAIEMNNGYVFEIVGDAFCAAFENPNDAVRASLSAQINLANENWKDARIKIRSGIHTGKAEWNGKRFTGYITLARTSRIMSAAYGEQILVSDTVYEKIKTDSSKSFWPEGLSRESISFRYLGERRLKDLVHSIRLYQISAAGMRNDFPPLKTLDARPNNLPVQVTSFVGRENEIMGIKNSLNRTHLLTLTGAGGSGKTRIALQTGAEIIDDFAHGVWFVEFSALSESQLPAAEVARALGIIEQPNENIENTLAGYLKDKELMLIMDNCEHIVESVSKLTEDILKKCPKVKILATSRETLRCEGEQTHLLLPLEYPDLSENSFETLSKYESVNLFVERALTVNQNFRINKENAKAVAEICYRLDGIPLAIELAAARTKSLSADQIHQRLDDRFGLLTKGKRTAMPRQQTLRAMIDWSYDLLRETEKKLWARLSVFEGGWTLEEAELICPGEDSGTIEIADIMDELTAKSIIIFDTESSRYFMLETIREYGREKLKPENEYQIISANHLKYFTKFAQTAAAKFFGHDIYSWLKKTDVEYGNLKSAVGWALENGRVSDAAALTVSLLHYWKIRGYFSEGIALLESVYSRSSELSDDETSNLLFCIGSLTKMAGDFEKAEKSFGVCLKFYSKNENHTGIIDSKRELGNTYVHKGEYNKAMEMFNSALAIARETNDLRRTGILLIDFASIALQKGEYEKASALYKESGAALEKSGDKISYVNSLYGLAQTQHVKGEYETATINFKEVLTIFKELDYRQGIANSLSALGGIEMNKGNFLSAASYFEEAISLRRKIGERSAVAYSLLHLGFIHRSKRDFERASDLYNEGLEIFIEIGKKQGIAYALENLAFVERDKGNLDAAEKLFEKTVVMRVEAGEKGPAAESMLELGVTAMFNSDFEKADRLLKDSLKIYGKLNNKNKIANALIELGNSSFYQGKFDKAESYFEECLELSRETKSQLEFAGSTLGMGRIHFARADPENAWIKYKQSLDISRQKDFRNLEVLCLIGMSEMCFAKGEKEDAAEILGEVSALMELNRTVLMKADQSCYDELMSGTRKIMKEEEFRKNFERGRLKHQR